MSDRDSIHDILNVLSAAEQSRSTVHGWKYKGAYQSQMWYERGDVVRCAGSTYVAISDQPGQCPNDAGWALVAQAGEKGEKGDPGKPGLRGFPGETGPPGKIGAPGRSIRWRGKYAPFTPYHRDDVVNFDNALWIALRTTEEAPKADQINWDLVIRFLVPSMDDVFRRLDEMENLIADHSAQHEKPDGADTIASMMYMVGNYTSGMAVKQGAVAHDSGWLMHANKDTSEPAAPQPVGAADYQYAGTSPETSSTAKQVISGQRYTVVNDGWITGYRVYVQVGGYYEVILVTDPLGAAPVISQIITFTADATGWVDAGVDAAIILQGEVYDVLQLAVAPDPVTSTWSGDWFYDTPPNDGAPGIGEILHSNSNSSVLNIHMTDDADADRSAELRALSTGDQIETNGLTWTIQGITDNGTYMTFGVSPATQFGPDGVKTFDFHTVTASPVTYLEDTDYWLAPGVSNFSIKGLLTVDGAIDDRVENDNAYGVDLKFQRANVSPDWDLMAYSSGN